MIRTIQTLTFSLFILCTTSLHAQTIVISGSNTCNETDSVGSWIVPTGITEITVDVYGAGGGGGGSGGGSNGGLYDTRGGGGGGAGGHSAIALSVTPGTSFSYNIGAGGCGGDPGGDFQDGDDGADGGNTSFAGFDSNGTPINLVANGGLKGGGGDGTEGDPGTGGAGGTSSGGSTNTTGGFGSDGNGGDHGTGGSAAGPNGGMGGIAVSESGMMFGGGGSGGTDSEGGLGATGGVVITLSNPVGLEKNREQSFSASLRPNPIADNTWLELTVAENDHFNISLSDISGRVLRIIHIGNLDAGIQRFQMSSELVENSGVYILNVQSSSVRSSIKTVVP